MELFSSKEGLCFQQLITYPEIKINADCFSFITGKSGCGKSTYLRMLSATLSAPDGQIFYRSKPLEDYPVLDYRKEVMLVPQQVFLFDGTIRENFDLFYDMREEKQPLDEDVQRFLSICCADFPLSANCATLSGGERQRVFLAIFLSAMPKVLLLDEPTASCIYTQKGNKKIRKPQAVNQTALIFARRVAARLLSINSIRRLCWS